MKTSDFDYNLNPELIAQTPAEPRDFSRLMVVRRDGASIEHHHVYDLPELLIPGDVLVLNDTRVIPARIHAIGKATGNPVELLLLKKKSENTWQALVKPGRRMKKGVIFETSRNQYSVRGEILEVCEDGTRIVFFENEDHLNDIGVVPLPPYIDKPLDDIERYQTVYSSVRGSVAAPTAGLHFTTNLLTRIREMGVETVFVTLHVGWGSFRPVSTANINDHNMSEEYWMLQDEPAELINNAKNEGRRVISVGTTAVRLLEQVAALTDGNSGKVVEPGSGWADIFIRPGYQFKVVDALITNFHLPKSTLLMLTSAFAGRDLILSSYQVAANDGYQFYSFGDAMLIV